MGGGVKQSVCYLHLSFIANRLLRCARNDGCSKAVMTEYGYRNDRVCWCGGAKELL